MRALLEPDAVSQRSHLAEHALRPTRHRALHQPHGGRGGVKNCILEILVIGANFGDLILVCVWTSNFAFWVDCVTSYWDQFWQNLKNRIDAKLKVMIIHREKFWFGSIFIQFGQFLNFVILGFKDFKFWILGSRISNFEISPILSISAKF